MKTGKMSFYGKVITSRYYYIAKTNKLKPDSATISYVSFFHIINVFSMLSFLGFDGLSLEKMVFVILFGGLYMLSLLLHYKILLGKLSFKERLQQIKVSSLAVYDFIHLLYELITIAFLFYTLDIYWGNYLYVFLFLLGIYLISKVNIWE